MKRRRMIYEGKAKILYEGPEPGTLIQYFKDDTTAFDATKKATIEGKGVLNNRISEYLMTQLNGIGVPTHFVKRLNMREQLVKEVEIVPLEVVARNVAAGSLARVRTHSYASDALASVVSQSSMWAPRAPAAPMTYSVMTHELPRCSARTS